MTFNIDQDKAHKEAFVQADVKVMLMHLLEEHDWDIQEQEEYDPYAMRAMHAVSHENPYAHVRRFHVCLSGPLCAKATKQVECSHSSCMEQVYGRQCDACMYESMDGLLVTDPVLCGEHGWTFITDAGSNSGFMGEGVWWERWACGHGHMESGEVVP